MPRDSNARGGSAAGAKDIIETTAIVARDFAAAINREHAAACQSAQSALQHARRAGELLIEAKAARPHGAWLHWLEAHCPAVSPRVAQLYMRICREWPRLEAAAKANRVSHLPVREALVLLAEHAEDAAPLARARHEAIESEREWNLAAAEINVLVRALDSPDLTLDEAVTIACRANAIGNRVAALRIRAERRLGELLNDSPWLGELGAHPELWPAFDEAVNARIAELDSRP